ncbi:MAG TPA: hypothetical protein VGF79_08980 [Bacteroidia bacterium]
MKSVFLTYSIALMAGISVLTVSCRKDTKDTLETIESAEDNSTAENEFTSLFDVADDFSSNDSRTRSGNTILPSGAVVNFSDSTFNDGDGVECTIDFGQLKSTTPKGILCNDGRYRAGVVHLSISKRYLQDSSVVEISAGDADNFYAGSDGVNLTKLTGTLKVTRTSANSLRIEVINARAINDKGTVSWQSVRNITKTLDNGAGILGDQFEVTGQASGVNRNGENFTVSIDVPLVKKVEMGCARTFIKGKITLTNASSGKTIKIDYDPFNDGRCDLTAKATINNKEYYYSVR